MNEIVVSFSNGKNNFYRSVVNIFLFMGFASFSFSLFMPSFFTSAEDIYGYWVLITGWIGLIFIQLAWFANPVNLLAILLAKDKPRLALLLSMLAIALASGSFLFYEIPTGINYEKVFIKEFGFGFYIWFLAHIFILLALFTHFLDSIRKKVF